jgi:hypothetical protein
MRFAANASVACTTWVALMFPRGVVTTKGRSESLESIRISVARVLVSIEKSEGNDARRDA